MKRLCIIENHSYHHIYSKSIYRFEIFTSKEEYQRMLNLMSYYQFGPQPFAFTRFIEKSSKEIAANGFESVCNSHCRNLVKSVELLAYCLMPTHIHFILQQIEPHGIENFMRLTLNAYSKYFNLRHNRRGPLWEHRFGNRLITDEQGLNNRIQYLLNNPVKSRLVRQADQWPYAKNLLNTGC